MTGQKLDSLDQWNEKAQRVNKSHPNAARLNNFLLNELAKANDKALELETKGETSAKDVKTSLKPIEDTTVYFQDYAKNYLEEQRLCGNYDLYKNETTHLKKFYDFLKGEKIEFEDITVDLVQRYVIYLRMSKKFQFDKTKPSKPLSERTIVNHLIIIRTLYNRAVSANIVSQTGYPFGGKGKISIKFPNSTKMGLEESEIKKLEELDLSEFSPMYDHARNIWLIEFYFAGMRVTDCLLLKWTDFQSGRLYYRMSNNDEPGSVKVPNKAKAILDKYKDQDTSENKHRLVFPFLQNLESLDDRYSVRKRIAYTNRRLNRMMPKLMEMIESTKNASQHKARHSFAQRG